MSAFLVDEKTLYKTMRGIVLASTNSWDHSLSLKIQKNPKKVFQELNFLNRFALNQRYDDHMNEGILKFNYSEWINCKNSDVECYKALSCFMYQCSEGSTVRKKLFKTIDKLQNSLASLIVSKLQEYKNASWG